MRIAALGLGSNGNLLALGSNTEGDRRRTLLVRITHLVEPARIAWS